MWSANGCGPTIIGRWWLWSDVVGRRVSDPANPRLTDADPCLQAFFPHLTHDRPMPPSLFPHYPTFSHALGFDLQVMGLYRGSDLVIFWWVCDLVLGDGFVIWFWVVGLWFGFWMGMVCGEPVVVGNLFNGFLQWTDGGWVWVLWFGFRFGFGFGFVIWFWVCFCLWF